MSTYTHTHTHVQNINIKIKTHRHPKKGGTPDLDRPGGGVDITTMCPPATPQSQPQSHLYHPSVHAPCLPATPRPHHPHLYSPPSIHAPYPPAALAPCDRAFGIRPRPAQLLRIDHLVCLLLCVSNFGFFACFARGGWREES